MCVYVVYNAYQNNLEIMCWFNSMIWWMRTCQSSYQINGMLSLKVRYDLKQKYNRAERN